MLIALVAGCGGGSDATTNTGGTPPSASNDGAGSLIITRPEGLAEYNLESGATQVLIPAEKTNTFFLDPGLSPDGARLVFVRQEPPVVEPGRYDAGSDLWIANRDGTNARPIFKHEQDNQLVRFPQWQDNQHVLVVIQEITTVEGRASVAYILHRINVETGEREPVLRDVLGFTVSPDGRRIAYAKLAIQTGETFEAVDIDGSDPTTLVPLSENLNPFQSPRYSPSGDRIAFASADQTGASLGERYVTTRPLGRSAAPALDGLPEDIWTMDAEGGRPQRVADLKEDLPALTWNGDGTRIYVVGAYGMYDVNLENGNTTRIGDGVYHAQIAWAP
jgi:Tol biopolymer transport system component